MTRYHINPDTGNANICRADVQDCRFKTSDNEEVPHYATKREAAVAYELSMKENEVPSVGVNKRENTTASDADFVAAWRKQPAYKPEKNIQELSNIYHNNNYLAEIRDGYEESSKIIEGVINFENDLSDELVRKGYGTHSDFAMVEVREDGSVNTELSVYDDDDAAVVKLAEKHNIGKLFKSRKNVSLPYMRYHNFDVSRDVKIDLRKVRKEGAKQLELHRGEARAAQMRIDHNKKVLSDHNYVPGESLPENAKYNSGYTNAVSVGDFLQVPTAQGSGTRKVTVIKPFTKRGEQWIRYYHDDGSVSVVKDGSSVSFVKGE